MEPSLFFGFVAMLIVAILVIKYKIARIVIAGGIAVACFFLVGWGLI